MLCASGTRLAPAGVERRKLVSTLENSVKRFMENLNRKNRII